MTRKQFFIDSIGTTTFSVILYLIFSNINLNLEFLNPISKTFENFQLTDFVFSQLRETPPYDENIVLVNIGNLDREGIAAQLEIINEYNPKVVGIDARFLVPKHDPDPIQDSLFIVGDSALSRAIAKIPNMVMACELVANAEEQKIDTVLYSHDMFMKGVDTAYVNTLSEGLNTFKTWREQYLFESVGNKEMMAFATKLASIYNPDIVNKLKKRNNSTEIINFRGNIDCISKDVGTNSKIAFAALDFYQVLERQFDPSLFKDKIVILGFMGEDFGTYSTTDRFFTPLNPNYIGRADQDMYGVVVHANIVSMLLNNDYIDVVPELTMNLINLVLIFINILMFTYLYYKLEIFWDGLTLIISVIQALALTYVIVSVFNKYDLILDFSTATVALFLMPNIIELYYGLVKPVGMKLRNSISGVSSEDNEEDNTNIDSENNIQ